MSRPLNFLHITTFYPPYSFGGDALYIYRLAHALGDAGHSVDVIHCIDSYNLLHPEAPPIEFRNHPNVKTHGLVSGMKWFSPLLTQQTGRSLLKRNRIREIMASRPYDVIQYHNTSLIGLDALEIDPPEKSAIKIYTTHEHWLVCPTHVLWKFGSRVCEKPECFRCTIKAGRPPQLWRYTNLLDRACSHIDQFAAPSRFAADMHAARGFSQPIEVLPYFIDADASPPLKNEQIHTRPYFLFVGRLEIIKGLQTLIGLWDRVPDFDLVVAGTGEYESTLRAMAKGNPRIVFLGACSQERLGTLYANAIGCIVPSVTYETFGMVIVEAFARKTPVVVRDLGALPEIVRQSDGGFVFRTDDELVEAIYKLGHSKTLRNEIGERGLAAYRKNWSREAHMRMYFELLARTAMRKFGQVPWHSTTTPRDKSSIVEPRAGKSEVDSDANLEQVV